MTSSFRNSAKKAVHKGRIATPKPVRARTAVTKLAEKNAACRIKKHMLPNGQRGKANDDRHQKGCCAPRDGNAGVPTNANPAEPADQAMDGRKKVIRRVDPI